MNHNQTRQPMQPTSDTHMAPTPVRFVDKAHVLMSDGWVVRGVCLHVCVCSLPRHLTPRLGATACKLTGWTIPPSSTCKKPRAAASRCGCKLGVRRGKQRWSALVSAPSSRLAKCMRARLGESAWSAFVSRAETHYNTL